MIEAGDGILDVTPNVHGNIIHQVGSVLVTMKGIMSCIARNLIAIFRKEGWPM
jgi:hypothetical protein